MAKFTSKKKNQEQADKLKKENNELEAELDNLKESMASISMKIQDTKKENLRRICICTCTTKRESSGVFVLVGKPNILLVERHRFIKELLIGIREFDGSTDVEAFINQIRNVRD